MMWGGTLVLTAVVVYLLRYVWRVLLFGASYQLAVELREDFYRQHAAGKPPRPSAPAYRPTSSPVRRCNVVP